MHPAPAAPAQATPASEAGYQWKQVFLPHGTRLRASGNRNAWKAVWLRLLDGAQPAARHRASAPVACSAIKLFLSIPAKGDSRSPGGDG